MNPSTSLKPTDRPHQPGTERRLCGWTVPSGRLVLPFLLATGLVVGSSGALAWGAKAYYPTSASPTMPEAEHAKRIAVAPPAIFRLLSDAHQVSRDRGWKGIGPAFHEGEVMTPE